MVYFRIGDGTSYVDTKFTIYRLYLGGEASGSGMRGVWIGKDGSLTVRNTFEINVSAGSQIFHVASGGTLDAQCPLVIRGIAGQGGTGGVTNEGAVSSKGLLISGGGVFEMKGGTLYVDERATLGASNEFSDPNQARFVQSGGEAKVTGALHSQAGGTYEISGGSLHVDQDLFIGFTDETPYSEGGSPGDNVSRHWVRS